MPSTASPAHVRDDDLGDATHLNFAYQYGYGVILRVGAARGELPYTTLWCEHHDDFLCERGDGFFDAFQVKTRQPENGAWKLTGEDFVKSVRRFVEMDRQRPGWVQQFHFVSNTGCSNSVAKDKIGLSPRQLLRAVQASPDGSRRHADDDVNGKLGAALTLAGACACMDEGAPVVGPVQLHFERTSARLI